MFAATGMFFFLDSQKLIYRREFKISCDNGICPVILIDRVVSSQDEI